MYIHQFTDQASQGHVTVFGGTHAHLAQEAWFAPSFVHLVKHVA